MAKSRSFASIFASIDSPESVSGFMLCVIATEKQTATMEITDIRLEAPPDSRPVDHSPEAAIQVNVTDVKGKPLAAANVTLDAERTDAARSAKTDAKGIVSLVPSGERMRQAHASDRCGLSGDDDGGDSCRQQRRRSPFNSNRARSTAASFRTKRASRSKGRRCASSLRRRIGIRRSQSRHSPGRRPHGQARPLAIAGPAR